VTGYRLRGQQGQAVRPRRDPAGPGPALAGL